MPAILHIWIPNHLINYYVLLITANSSLKAGKVSQDDLMTSKWTRLGEGGFSNVFKATLKGNVVAIKVLKDFKESKALFTEGNLLRYIDQWH